MLQGLLTKRKYLQCGDAFTLESHPDILDLARQVAEKCHGLPLVLNIIGENMASKRTVEEWEQAVDTLASSAAEFPGMEDHILPVLKYSYDSLKGEVGRLLDMRRIHRRNSRFKEG
ncbi:unnamed protein product [Eruca vesicaria subsp. sativa]|uniref:NB-ARC domain-containing protein n=1 Tax=Eruca vesicaria subsp. sativa TaxID=29727 RepID=A0ABC8LYV8_ERUVS|nr:unnamed protein product [Eruca vesicaria subsp. sativa]